MRVTSMFAGFAVALAACGGGEQKTDGQQTTTPDQQTAPAPAGAAATGTTHDVDMVLEGTSYKFVPANLTIKSGDVVNFHNKSGFPHNVSFWADSIPSGASQVLQATMPDQMQPLQGPLLSQAGQIYTVGFANAPAGTYKYYCLPHLPMGMMASITVQ
jgi:plastocyanin